jgi:radical S-adenosyl methionine domain-containing protein 2
MECKFCYATYNTFGVQQQLRLDEVYIILRKLHKAGVKKVTFAGGEPMLYKQLDHAIIYAKKIGLVTSIVTNGSMLTASWLKSMVNHLDWIGLSIDSINTTTNTSIGRITTKQVDYTTLISCINSYGYKLKINTVVNIHNQHEVLSDLINESKTTRWKVFDTLKVEGQNDTQFNKIKSTNFEQFIKNNQHPSMVVETNSLMSGSYLLIDPKGRFYENWGTNNIKSDSLIKHSIKHCLSQISLDRKKFLDRGGIYNW